MIKYLLYKNIKYLLYKNINYLLKMCSLNASLIINNKESIPLYLILKYVDPIIALQLFLNDNDTVDKKISIK